jgi:integrase
MGAKKVSEILPTGINRERGRGFMVEVHVRPYPRARKRFPLETPIDVMLAWRTEQLEKLTAAKADRARATAADPVTTAARRQADANTFRQDVELYLEEKIDPSLHPCTKTQFSRWLRQAAATELGRYPRQLITGAMWTKLVAQWERSGVPSNEARGGRRRIVPPGPLAVDTVHKIRTCFIGFYTTMDVGLGLSNPARLIPRRQTSDPEPRGIAMAQALEILGHVGRSGEPTRTAARLTLMCVLGLRPVEIMRIRPATDWHKAQQQLIVRTAKGGKARTLPLGDRAVAALELLDRLKGWGTFTSAPAARMFHDAVKAAKLTALEPLRPYDLRHTFGTELYRQTKDIKATGAAMGHRNLAQTERYVEASVSETVANAFSVLERSMPKAAKAKRRRGKLRAV